MQKNTVFPLNFGPFLLKSDESDGFAFKCFAFYLPINFSKLHIPMVNRRASQPKTGEAGAFLAPIRVS
jgi:hypothetical protein